MNKQEKFKSKGNPVVDHTISFQENARSEITIEFSKWFQVTLDSFFRQLMCK